MNQKIFNKIGISKIIEMLTDHASSLAELHSADGSSR